jgi:hypothetical protein
MSAKRRCPPTHRLTPRRARPPPQKNKNSTHSNDSLFSRVVPTVLGLGAFSSVMFGIKSLLFDESGN